MERTKLKAARLARGLSQPEVAAEIGCSKGAIGLWERGEADPQDYWILQLCTFFGKNPAELDLASELTESELAMLQEILKNRKVNRRQALAIVTLPAFVEVDLSTLSKPSGSPGAFLRLCRTSIDTCWYLLDHNGYTVASNLLKESMTALSDLATRSSEHQGLAASLAVEAKVIQMAIATHKLDYRGRELLGSEAVEFGELSGDGNLHAVALGWHGDTYKYCFFQPETAIANFKDALKCGDISLLNKASIFSDLSLAYALDKNQKKARDHIELAQMTMPQHPESDPLYRCIRTGQSELDQRKGRVYLILSRYFPKEGYAQMAYDVSVEALSKPSVSASHHAEVLIQKADAARGIGNFDEFIKALEEGVLISFQIGNERDKDHAMKVLGKAPDGWKKEQRYKTLVKMF